MADAVALMDYVKPDVLGLDSSRSDQGGCYVDCLSDHICTTPSDEICGGNDEIPYQRFVATSTNPVTLVAGNTYTNPNYYDGNGAAGEVQQGGTLTAVGTAENKIVFAGNTASADGAAVFIDGGTAIFDNATFADNTASAGAVFNCGTLTITGSTFSRNTAKDGGGAIMNGGEMVLGNVVFSDNVASSSVGGAIDNSYGTIKVVGVVTLSTATDTWCNCGNSAVTNWDLTNAEPGNSVCINGFRYFSNDDSAKQTITVSAAQTLGNYTIATGVGSDLTNKNTFTITGVAGKNDVSITVGGSRVLYNGITYTLQKKEDALVLNAFQRFVATSTNPVTLVAGNTYTNPAYYNGSGAAGEVQEGGTLTAVGTAENKIVFTGNTASTSGGAVYISGGSATFTNVSFSGNTSGHGGAIYNKYGTVTLSNATFSGNSAFGNDGGAIANQGILSVSDSVFCYNRAMSFGGAIETCGKTTITGTTFSYNQADDGGAVLVYKDGPITISDTLFCNNVAQNNGGAIDNGTASATSIILSNVTFEGNTAQKGGAVFNSRTMELSSVTFSSNSASEYGGAIYNGKDSRLILTGNVYLQTDSDTIYNNGTLNWNITESNAGYLNNYGLLENHGTLSITVDADQQTGNYILAGNASSASAQTFTLTGVAGQADVSITVNGDAKSYNGIVYSLQNQSDSLVLSVADTIFYCSSWTESETVSVTWHGNTYKGSVGNGIFFRDYAAAKTAAQAANNEIVVMESGTITKSTSYGAQNIDLASEKAVYTRMVIGGELKGGNHLDYAGSYTVNIEAGTFASDVAGGDAANGYVLRTGNVTVNVSGGTFAKSFTAGSYYATEGSVLGVAAISGDVTLTISGGSFDGRVYGGCGAMTDTLGACARLQGDAYLTIDASSNAISFGECIAAGNRGHGIISGSTNVTVTGQGANLTFADESVLFGGCSGDCYKTEGGVRTEDTSVTGARKLAFDNFTGDFGAEIRMFSDITFENNTNMNFSDAKLDLKEMGTWNFDCTSFASNLNQNQFAGDTINVDTTDLASSWTLLSGSVEAFADLGSALSVSFSGSTATWSGSAWSDGTYTLALDDQKTSLIVSKIG